MAMVSSKLVFSRRRTLALEIDREGQLIVRAPYGTPKSYIDRFIAEKKEWIESHAARMRCRRARYRALSLREGETLPILGRKVTLRMTEEKDFSIREMSGELFFPVNAAKADLQRYLCALLMEVLQRLVSRYAALMELPAPTFSLSKARTRWGSCSSRGHLRFNWHLIFCTPSAVEYVVVHELCHLFSMHHDRVFWSYVESCLPDRKVREGWLKQNQGVMEIL
ncbi:MAG: M48 family metallopeptidase [Acidaminococcus intestini]|uniref:M48 family metallopeptidase n=2 Tax=Acidaminococcus TaxID=904 RepID=A0A943EBK0_9FIRM|nr:M48 family metallopeptidase [Acidaminococcus intestini]